MKINAIAIGFLVSGCFFCSGQLRGQVVFLPGPAPGFKPTTMLSIPSFYQHPSSLQLLVERRTGYPEDSGPLEPGESIRKASPFLLGGSGVLGVFCGIMKVSSVQAYNRYKKPENIQRESEYRKANNRQRVAIVSGLLSGACLLGSGIAWQIEKGNSLSRRPIDNIRIKSDAQFSISYNF